ncbi:type IV secretion system protein [Nocardiopsis ansamitocini]|uniref:TrbL/VirB6 plasmid conjugal transfer protein n=1 Tax=Nocardiopsis ansamitocini TaxID=1670832 RepID=A0A9W6P407_9ACTN|nr:type IV secretion system protein [Nocardiopsis ansamitocini]GLU46815.1 hypothetical protein Nans01_11660 [Nocardiopsis ansamitocini]
MISTPPARRTGWRRIAFLAVLMCAFFLVPVGSVQAAVPGCEGEPAPQPEAAGSGADGLLVPPQSQAAIDRSPDGLPPDASLYGQYGTSGQQWHVIRESCVDKLGSSAVATLSNTAWDLSKTINQSTITVYQAATSDGLLASFNQLVESVVVELREGIWRPLLPTVVILGAVWLGWYGLIRKRVTLTIESAVWMVLATALGIWILVNPAQIMGYASTLVNSGGQLVNSAVSRVSISGSASSCPTGAPEIEKAAWESENDFAVRSNSQMLWSGLVCRPWIAGEFGTGPTADIAAEQHGVALLQAQGISKIEQQQINRGEVDANELIEEKQGQYQEIAESVQSTYPGIYPLFEGNQQGGRLGVSTLALFASIFAGGLILAGSVALIVLKIGFLLLLLLSPIFLLIGIHPGYGRMVLIRWMEMLLGMLLKQIFVVLLISLLVMSYGLVMSSTLGWGLQMILLALFTLALFIYRKPFAHLFASVNANTFTSRMVSDAMNSRVLANSANVLPPVAYMRAQKWGLRNAPQLAAAASAVPAGGAPPVGGIPGDGTEQTRGAAAGADAGAGDGSPVRGEQTRARGAAAYGRAHNAGAAPPLHLGEQPAGGADGGKSTTAAPRRTSDQAPRLSGTAAAGGSAEPRGPIPPRPSGGYTGTGDTGWGSVFGTGGSSGNAQRAPSAAASNAADAPRAAAPDSGTGQGVFGRRADAPHQDGAAPRASRWAGLGARDPKRTPPPRPTGPAPLPRDSGKSDNWLKGSGKDKDAPTSPFWTGDAARRRDAKRDIPFWLDNDD